MYIYIYIYVYIHIYIYTFMYISHSGHHLAGGAAAGRSTILNIRMIVMVSHD